MERNQGDRLRRAMPDLHSSEEVKQYLEEYEKKKLEEYEKKKLGNAALKLQFFLENKDKEVYQQKEIWQEKFIESNIIQPENFTDKFWNNREEFARNEGRNENLNDDQKAQLIEGYQEDQKKSLTTWLEYLDQNTGEDKQYPEWFREYVLQSLPKMATFNKEKQRFDKRTATTVAPFPPLNPASLANVYSTLDKEYNKELEDESDKELFKNSNVPNFNKLYSKKILEIKTIVDTPELAKDVKGEWKVYKDNPKELAEAAQGTPWCIADENMAASYQEKQGSTFHLFHLEDPKTNILSSSAAISVRTNEHGNVVEVSGLKGGSNQYLEDSLVPTAHEKVKGMPGGEKYITAFEDKQRLIVMDKKFQSGEDFSLDELEFLYEINRSIQYVDTYSDDPRPKEFKDARREQHIEQLEDKYGNIHELISKLNSHQIADNLDILIGRGADIDQITIKLDPHQITDNLDSLIEHEADIDVNELVSKLGPYQIANNLDVLIKYGADANKLVDELDSYQIAENLDSLIEHGADIDVNELVSKLEPYQIANNLDSLIEHVANIDDIDKIVDGLDSREIANNLNVLIEHGANIDIDKLVGELDSWEIIKNLNVLFEHGANIDIDKIVDGLDSREIANNLNVLIKHKADVNKLVSKLEPDDIARDINVLIKHKADVNKLVSKLEPDDIAENLEKLIRHGADIDIDKLVDGLDSYGIAENLDTLIEHKANIDVDKIVGEIINDNDFDDDNFAEASDSQIMEFFNHFIKFGADANKMVDKITTKLGKTNELIESYRK